MQPFLATYQPALSDDCRYVHDFGELPVDVAQIVVRSIPEFERTSLLSLALVNKTSYFLTRSQRGILAARNDIPMLSSCRAALVTARQLEHMLHLVGDPDSTLCDADKHALLCNWLDANRNPDEVLRLLNATLSLAMPEKGDLLWRIVGLRRLWIHTELMETAMPVWKQAADCLPEAEKAGFELACSIGLAFGSYLHAESMAYAAPNAGELTTKAVNAQKDGPSPTPLSELLKRSFEQGLAQARAWQFPALPMVLRTLMPYCYLHPFQQQEDLFIEIIHATAAWPAAQRLRMLQTLTEFAVQHGCGADLADCMAQNLLLLAGGIDASCARNDVHTLSLLNQLHTVCQRFAHLHAKPSGTGTVAALESMQKRIATRLLECMLAASAHVQRKVSRDVDELMRSLYGWGWLLPQWQEGFRALCLANRRTHGVSYGDLKKMKDLAPFDTRSHETR